MKNAELKNQMELGLETRGMFRSRGGNKKRPGRSGWWFTQMRRVVDKAIDWTPQSSPRPHQVYFTIDQQSPNW